MEFFKINLDICLNQLLLKSRSVVTAQKPPGKKNIAQCVPGLRVLKQRSPTFFRARTSSVSDNIVMDRPVRG